MSLSLESVPLDPEHPWPGLGSFGESEQHFFHGREEELQELLERVQHRPLTVLFAQSGLGKTSLLQAGLVPRLRQAGFHVVLVRLRFAGEAPPLEQQVLERLGFAPATGAGPERPGLWQCFHDPLFASRAPHGQETLLVFDQFEEAFTQEHYRPEDVIAFRSALASLVQNSPPPELRRRTEEDEELALRLDYKSRPCKVLISLRADFLPALERWRRFMPEMMTNRFELRPLTGRKALRAVTEPAAQRANGERLVDEGTAESIVRFVAGAGREELLEELEVAPSLLSLLCSELNAARLEASPPGRSIDGNLLHGRAEDILQSFYERSLRAQPEGVRRVIEERLLSSEGYRESVTENTLLGDLAEVGLTGLEANRALAELIGCRLLAAEEHRGRRRLELTHDILCQVARESRNKRRQIEARERAHRNRLEAAAEGMNVWTALPSGELDWVNHHVASYFGTIDPDRDLLGAAWSQFIHPDDLARVAEEWATSLQTGKRYETQFRLKREDGEYRWHLVRADPMLDPAGEIVKWFGTNVDVHDLKQAAGTDSAMAVLAGLCTPLSGLREKVNSVGGDPSLPGTVRAVLAEVGRELEERVRLIESYLSGPR